MRRSRDLSQNIAGGNSVLPYGDMSLATSHDAESKLSRREFLQVIEHRWPVISGSASNPSKSTSMRNLASTAIISSAISIVIAAEKGIYSNR